MIAGAFQNLGQGGLTLFLQLGTFDFFGTALVLGDLHADLLRQILHGIDETDATMLHQEADCIAMHTATETMVGLACRADDEAWGLFTVKRTESLVIDAGFFEFDIAADHHDDVDAGEQILDKAGWNHSASLSQAKCRGLVPGQLNGGTLRLR